MLCFKRAHIKKKVNHWSRIPLSAAALRFRLIGTKAPSLNQEKIAPEQKHAKVCVVHIFLVIKLMI